jgi:hypothetical protein
MKISKAEISLFRRQNATRRRPPAR